ncbi:uncharacterized protein LOC135844187 [Planococcus citri]|uniref:uncharacterized protein LOC135844187 n=1 Tax=Planococcus citri TaxID=170843 RepID=UPI0031F8F6D3
MKTGCFGQSLSVTITITLYITVIVNIYNLILGSSNFNDATKLLFGHDHELEMYLYWTIIGETIFSIFAIMFGTKQYTSYIMFSIRFWTYGLTFATMFLDCVFTSMASYYLINTPDLRDYWEKIKNIDWNEPIIPPAPMVPLYILIAALCYCVFKSYAAITILRVQNIFSKGSSITRDGAYATSHDNDIERNENTVSPPPRYEQCVLLSEPPPPYSVTIPKDN